MRTGFQLRAPWYVRERRGVDVNDPASLRPAIQKYDDKRFVERLITDPRDSLKFVTEDTWSYPVPSTPSPLAKGRARFATYELVHTDLRKLYQPSHDRFYAVVVEVFCDTPGLPRAGSHDEFEVAFVLRRQATTVTGEKRPVKLLARRLLAELAKQGTEPEVDSDWRTVWWADVAKRRQFEEENAGLFAKIHAHTDDQGWVRASGWRELDGVELLDGEQDYPMWRVPSGAHECAPAKTRSTWFGVVPTYSSEHWVDGDQVAAKLDDEAVYYVQPFVRIPGHELCPPKIFWGSPSEPFRLADPMDPDGTKNRIVTIKLPDLRKLAARSARKQGPGGVRIITPPQSHLGPVPVKDIPSAKAKVGSGGQVCTFALELFFVVAFFLFLLFLPIVVFIFQLWFLLALRFCIPPSLSFGVMAQFFAAGKVLADLALPANADAALALGELTGLAGPDAANELQKPEGFGGDPTQLPELVSAMDPADSIPEPPPPLLEPKPDDPLCFVG
jgi:hypothetical protein